MLRKAYARWMIIALIFAGVTFMFLMVAVFTDSVSGEGQQALNENYYKNVISEQVIDMPCATQSRGVFYNASVISGGFDCFEAAGTGATVYLEFDISSGHNYLYRLSGGAVQQVTDGEAFLETSYGVVVYDTMAEQRVPATLRVGVQP